MVFVSSSQKKWSFSLIPISFFVLMLVRFVKDVIMSTITFSTPTPSLMQSDCERGLRIRYERLFLSYFLLETQLFTYSLFIMIDMISVSWIGFIWFSVTTWTSSAALLTFWTMLMIIVFEFLVLRIGFFLFYCLK